MQHFNFVMFFPILVDTFIIIMSGYDPVPFPVLTGTAIALDVVRIPGTAGNKEF